GFIDGIGKLLSGGITSLISTGIGATVKGLGSLFSKLFGGDKELKQVQQLRDEFIRTAGGMAELQRQADLAGISLTTLLNTKKVDAFKAAADQVNKAFSTYTLELEHSNEQFGILLKAADDLGGKLPDDIQGAINKLLDMKLITGDNVDLFKRLSG